MKKPYFSIILPVYNASAQLPATIRSILTQTERDFQLIMVDDGSTDDSLAIMMDAASKDQRIKLVSQSQQGVSTARNLGLELSQGTLIAFIDADDLWRPTKLAEHRACHEKFPSVDASFAQIAFIDQDAKDGENAKTFSSVPWGSLTVDQIIAENPTCTMSNLVVAKHVLDVVGGFETGMSYAEDQEWLARIANAGFAIAGIDQYLVDYRLSQDGLSVNLSAMYAGWKKLASKYSDVDQVRSAQAIYCRYLSRRALRSGAPAKVALGYALQGIRTDRLAFMSEPRRGWLTLISAFSALLLKRETRIQLFA